MFVLPTLIVGPLPHAGSLSLPLAITPGLPVGLELHMQWFNKAASGGWQSSRALLLTIASS